MHTEDLTFPSGCYPPIPAEDRYGPRVFVEQMPDTDRWGIYVQHDCYNGEWIPICTKPNKLHAIGLAVTLQILIGEAEERGAGAECQS